jgi:1,4-dihydroxy-2-naphthoate octaprenyltransferase
LPPEKGLRSSAATPVSAPESKSNTSPEAFLAASMKKMPGLSYRGLGEVAVAVCYGPLIASGTYLVQRGTVTLAGVPPMALLGAIGLVPATMAARRLIVDPERTARVIPAQRLTLLSFLLLAVGMGIGLLVA